MIRFLLFILSVVLVVPPPAAAAGETNQSPSIQVGPNRRVRVYKLESVEVRGSTRLSAEDLTAELGLTKGTELNDELVMTSRSKLLGLGLFRSVILIMRKGSSPGMARLIIDLEDDEGVLTDWALGGELSVTASESLTPAVDSNTSPMDYRIGLVGRNLFSSLHRGSFYLDLDGDANVRAGQLAYGFPRFTQEDVQFDAEVAASNPRYRYLDTMGFGGRGQGLWSMTMTGQGELLYGVAMYVNKKPDFAVTGFPDAVAGPKVAFFKETRLRGFFPGEGHQIGASFLLSPLNTEESILELSMARTTKVFDFAYFTLDAKALAVAENGYSFRGETRIDLPFSSANPDDDQAEAFLRLRGGQDYIGKVSLLGSAAILGVRYHSSGFIAELGLKITRSPEDFAPTTIKTTEADAGGSLP
jgi:hypothetical protein